MRSVIVLVIASVLSFAAHADPEGNCAAKIQKLEDIGKADGPGLAGLKVEEFRSLLEQAKAAQAEKNWGECSASADRAQTIYDTARGK